MHELVSAVNAVVVRRSSFAVRRSPFAVRRSLLMSTNDCDLRSGELLTGHGAQVIAVSTRGTELLDLVVGRWSLVVGR